MNGFLSALWAEALKARRSKVALLTAAGLSILPIVDGLFMVILKDPERARDMGLIGAKAQLTAGVADWPTFFYVLVLGTAIGGAILFAFITAWVFGREFSDHTAKELLALPTSRVVIVGAKFVLIAFWILGLALWIFAAWACNWEGRRHSRRLSRASMEIFLLLFARRSPDFLADAMGRFFCQHRARLPTSTRLGCSYPGTCPDIGCLGLRRLVPVGCSWLNRRNGRAKRRASGTA